MKTCSVVFGCLLKRYSVDHATPFLWVTHWQEYWWAIWRKPLQMEEYTYAYLASAHLCHPDKRHFDRATFRKYWLTIYKKAFPIHPKQSKDSSSLTETRRHKESRQMCWLPCLNKHVRERMLLITQKHETCHNLRHKQMSNHRHAHGEKCYLASSARHWIFRWKSQTLRKTSACSWQQSVFLAEHTITSRLETYFKPSLWQRWTGDASSNERRVCPGRWWHPTKRDCSLDNSQAARRVIPVHPVHAFESWRRWDSRSMPETVAFARVYAALMASQKYLAESNCGTDSSLIGTKKLKYH